MSEMNRQGFKELQWLIDSTKRIIDICKQFEEEIAKVDKHHRSIGFDGMAHRSKVMEDADPERYDKMRDEYTDLSRESMMLMRKVGGTIVGIFNGLEETFKARAEMSN